MTRIGAIEIKHSDAPCPLSFTLEVIEDGEVSAADFVYERHLYTEISIVPGGVNCSTGLRYRRAA